MANMTTTHSDPAKVEKTRATNGARRATSPVDIFENNEGFLILADVPGVEPEGLTIEYNPPVLSVSARPSYAPEGRAVVYERTFELGSGIDPQRIDAELRNGVLRIELKKSDAIRPRRIEVKSS